MPVLGFIVVRWMRSAALATLFVLAVVVPAIAAATQVTVRVLNVSAAGGVVRIALCRESEWQTHQCAYRADTAASAGVVAVSVDVPPGVYGVLVYHDANSDNVVNMNRMGMPIEGVGFSRNARLLFGFPAFSAVSMPITGDYASTDVSLFFEPLRDSQ